MVRSLRAKETNRKMAKHKLYRQFENTSPLTFSLTEEISPERDVHPSTPDSDAHARGSLVKSKCALESVANQKSENKKEVTHKEVNVSSSESSKDGDSDLDDFFSYCRSGLKVPYSAKEDEWILKYVLRGKNIDRVSSLSLWKHLESRKENPKRTYQSLKNRFLRNIKPHIFTRYGHLISGDKEVKKILAKFPELRCKVGRTNTLSRIQLPARNPNSKFAEGESVSRSRDNDERVPSPKTSTSDGPRKDSARQELILNMNFSNFERKVTVGGGGGDSVEVWVNFNSKQQLHKPVTRPIGIYERYENIKKKNKLILCAACGRYNQPRKNKLADSNGDGKSVNFNAGRQVLTANSSSGDPGDSSVTSSSPPAKCRKVGESGLSPSLLRDAGEEHNSPFGCGAQERSLNTGEVSRAPETPLNTGEVSRAPETPLNTGEVGRAPETPLNTGEVGRAPETPSPVALRQGADSAAADRLREAHDDLDSTYDDVVADFKKLIKNEEERLLVRKCLHGKGGILGLSESISQNSMESYFVDLSPNLETPVLTADYATANRQSNGVGEGGNSCGLLARNMMKMLKNA